MASAWSGQSGEARVRLPLPAPVLTPWAGGVAGDSFLPGTARQGSEVAGPVSRGGDKWGFWSQVAVVQVHSYPRFDVFKLQSMELIEIYTWHEEVCLRGVQICKAM